MSHDEVDVRKIVLDLIETDPRAAQLYLTEPAMRHGVHVTIGVLSRAVPVLLTTGGHTPDRVRDLVREIAQACAWSAPGQEDVDILAKANQALFTGDLKL